MYQRLLDQQEECEREMSYTISSSTVAEDNARSSAMYLSYVPFVDNARHIFGVLRLVRIQRLYSDIAHDMEVADVQLTE